MYQGEDDINTSHNNQIEHFNYIVESNVIKLIVLNFVMLHVLFIY